MSFVITEAILATAIADDGTLTLAYPSGTNQAYFTGANASATGAAVLNFNEVFAEADPGISLTYGSSDITLTNLSGFSWPAGSTLTVQLGRAGNDRPGFQRSPAITSLTDSSGGTAADTIAAIGSSYSQTEVRNAVASLTRKVNQILATMRIDANIQN